MRFITDPLGVGTEFALKPLVASRGCRGDQVPSPLEQNTRAVPCSFGSLIGARGGQLHCPWDHWDTIRQCLLNPCIFAPCGPARCMQLRAARKVARPAPSGLSWRLAHLSTAPPERSPACAPPGRSLAEIVSAVAYWFKAKPRTAETRQLREGG